MTPRAKTSRKKNAQAPTAPASTAALSGRKTSGETTAARASAGEPPNREKRNHAKQKGKAHGGRPQKPSSDGPVWLYGRHAVAAALRNPARRVRRIIATKNASDWLAEQAIAPATAKTDAPPGLQDLEQAKPDAIDRLLLQHAGRDGAVHQGLAAEVDELPRARLKDVFAAPDPTAPALVLDQITDPQNIGAAFRVAAAFGARGVIVQDRRTPPLAGVLAKAAAGAVDIVPCVRVVNIARALEALRDLDIYCAGLAGGAPERIQDIPKGRATAIVLGAEGAGLRPLVAATCNGLFHIPISPAMESLNVSTAAAAAMYEIAREN